MVRQMNVTGDDTGHDDASDYRLVASAEDGFAFGKPHAVAEVRPVSRKELKTAAELAAMIELDLAQHPDCPKNGFRVTVYGATHWRAMLTITTAAGRVRNPQQWRDLTDEFADRLRQRYDLAWT